MFSTGGGRNQSFLVFFDNTLFGLHFSVRNLLSHHWNIFYICCSKILLFYIPVCNIKLSFKMT